jgi:hypothetical protein
VRNAAKGVWQGALRLAGLPSSAGPHAPLPFSLLDGRRLSPNQLRALLREHGSWEAAIEARPDLADQLRGVQRIAETIREQARRSSV